MILTFLLYTHLFQYTTFFFTFYLLCDSIKNTKQNKGGFYIYTRMLEKQQTLETQITILQQKISTFPAGKLIYAKNGAGAKWYRSYGHKPIYIPKKERSLAEQLAYKKYLSLQLTNLLQEKKAVDSYLKYHNPEALQSEVAHVNSPEFQDLVAPNHPIFSEKYRKWMNSPYPQNNSHPENLIHKTLSGNLVRSKSEVLIDTILSKHQISFRYECLLKLNGASFYPDFTILHPKTGELTYWEHFGLMDNPAYAQNAAEKIQLYIANGIIPSIHLITTFETQENPLSLDLVEKIVEYHFS